MRQWLKHFAEDDLFRRMMQLVAALAFDALGVVIAIAAFHQPLASVPMIVMSLVAAAFLILGSLFMACCFAPPDSRLGRFARKFLPDAAGLDDAAVLVIFIALPAAFLTLVLRQLGVCARE